MMGGKSKVVERIGREGKTWREKCLGKVKGKGKEASVLEERRR